MNGYQACSALKELIKVGKLKDIHIVAFTADISDENKEKCNEA